MHVVRKSFLATVALAAVLALAATRPCAAGAPNPTPTDLGLLAGYQTCAPSAINASAQVVGECDAYPATNADPPTITPFIWTGGTLSALPLPGGFAAGTAVDINGSGQVVGSCWNWYWYFSDWEDYGWLHVNTQACRWQRRASGWSVTLLGAPAGKDASEALLINDAGQVYAHTWATNWSAEGSAVLVGGAWTELKDAYGDLVPLLNSPPQMNESGQVLAWSWFGGGVYLWTGGTAVPIVPNYYSPLSLDNLGRVAGAYWPDDAHPQTAFIYQPGADLQTAPVSTVGWLGAINDKGQVLFTQQATDANDTFLGTDVNIGGLTLGGPTTTIGRVPDVIMYYNTPFLNADGQVCGNAYYYNGGGWYAEVGGAGILQLDGLEGNLSEVAAMNDSGVIVGTSFAGDGVHAVLWGSLPPNQPPTANAGPDQTVAPTGATTSVTLNGSGSSDPEGGNLTYAWAENGTQIASGVSPTVALAPGVHAITLTVTDPYGATAQDAVTVTVGTYSWSGFLQPIDPPSAQGVSASVFKAGSVVPVKFALTGASSGLTNLAATLSYAQMSSGIAGTDVEATSAAAATSGSLFRYDACGAQYIYNWSTKGLTAGSYRLSVDMGDRVSRTIIVSLKK